LLVQAANLKKKTIYQNKIFHLIEFSFRGFMTATALPHDRTTKRSNRRTSVKAPRADDYSALSGLEGVVILRGLTPTVIGI